jgi:ankyrin repeat protein
MRLQRAMIVAIAVEIALLYAQCFAGRDMLRRTIGLPTTQELLMNAAASGNHEDLSQALDEGADPNARNEQGERPLIWAVRFDQPSVVRSLLRAGADVNLHDAHGETPLIQAASQGRMDLIEILMGAGADPRVHGRNGRTAAELAEEFGYLEVAQFLRNYAQKRTASVCRSSLR